MMIANFYALLYRTYFALEKSATKGGLRRLPRIGRGLDQFKRGSSAGGRPGPGCSFRWRPRKHRAFAGTQSAEWVGESPASGACCCMVAYRDRWNTNTALSGTYQQNNFPDICLRGPKRQMERHGCGIAALDRSLRQSEKAHKPAYSCKLACA